jgi:methylenetetrahydrofolate dehydrogenase (NADP+)/methenyltetrahydrofolate cyclohydrolase/formyltetrahydrofolate synthetase
MAQMLLKKDATVTICHSKTSNLPAIIATADILVSAVGVPNIVKGSWLKPGVVVIDVGINTITDTSKKAGYRFVGDVEFESARLVAKAISPVPGGVGPM